MRSVPKLSTYNAIYDAFKWNIPERYNIATDVCESTRATTTA